MGALTKKRGRPQGMRAIQLDLQEKLYNHPDNHKVIETINRAARDDNHKNQAASMKFLWIGCCRLVCAIRMPILERR